MNELIVVSSQKDCTRAANFCADRIASVRSRTTLINASFNFFERLRTEGFVNGLACLRDEKAYTKPAFRLVPFTGLKLLPRIAKSIDQLEQELHGIVPVVRDYTYLGRGTIHIDEIKQQYAQDPNLALLKILLFETMEL